MLILTRRPNEVINIGDSVKVTVLSINYGQVRIGIEAPSNITIDRAEITERKKKGLEARHKITLNKFPKGV